MPGILKVAVGWLVFAVLIALLALGRSRSAGNDELRYAVVHVHGGVASSYSAAHLQWDGERVTFTNLEDNLRYTLTGDITVVQITK